MAEVQSVRSCGAGLFPPDGVLALQCLSDESQIRTAWGVCAQAVLSHEEKSAQGMVQMAKERFLTLLKEKQPTRGVKVLDVVVGETGIAVSYQYPQTGVMHIRSVGELLRHFE